jgi:ABC-2 type transporter
MTEMIESDTDAYSLRIMNIQEATHSLQDQEIAAIITIPHQVLPLFVLLVLAPVSAWVLVAGRILGGLFASCAVLILAVGACILAGVISAPANHWPALAILFVATALSASAMGAILGTFLHGTRNIALAASILATYLFFLGGGFTTIAFLPQWLQTISAFNPILYSIEGMRQALFYPDLTGFSTNIEVLVGRTIRGFCHRQYRPGMIRRSSSICCVAIFPIREVRIRKPDNSTMSTAQPSRTVKLTHIGSGVTCNP